MLSLSFPQSGEVEVEKRYSRNIPALKKEECRLLRDKKIAVVGCGGLGGYILEFMARIGAGHIRVVDGDVFDETNLNRQLLSEVSLIGKSKPEAAAVRIKKINPDIDIEIRPVFLSEENAAELISGCDAVLDGLDNIESRKTLALACEELNIPYVFGAISGWVAQAAISMPGDKLVEKLYPETVELKDKSVLSFTPALCAALQASLCVKYLTGRALKSGRIYQFDLLDENFEFIGFEI